MATETRNDVPELLTASESARASTGAGVGAGVDRGGGAGADGASAGPKGAGIFSRGWVLIALVALVFTVPLARTLLRSRQPALPVLWQMPDWRLTDQDTHAFGARELAGRVYVADFIFTTCTYSCPRLTSRMALVQGRLRSHGDAVHLVSISVDPTTDTPERLRAFAARYQADFARWSFVTGPEDDVVRAVTQGFREGLVLPPRGPSGEFDPVALAHSNRFALVDARGRLRGSYVALDDHELDRLVTDVGRLVAERSN